MIPGNSLIIQPNATHIPTFLPSDLGSALIWWNVLNASTVTLSGSLATAIIDSGFAGTHDLSVAPSSDACTYSAAGGPNSQPCLTTDGTNFYTFAVGIDSTAPWTQYHVLSCVSSGHEGVLTTDASTTTIYANATGGNVAYYLGSMVNSATDIRGAGWIVLRIVNEGGAAGSYFRVRVDKNTEDTTANGNNMGATFSQFLGAASNVQCFDGAIAESLQVAGSISAANDNNIMTYLKNKYAFSY